MHMTNLKRSTIIIRKIHRKIEIIICAFKCPGKLYWPPPSQNHILQILRTRLSPKLVRQHPPRPAWYCPFRDPINSKRSTALRNTKHTNGSGGFSELVLWCMWGDRTGGVSDREGGTSLRLLMLQRDQPMRRMPRHEQTCAHGHIYPIGMVDYRRKLGWCIGNRDMHSDVWMLVHRTSGHT